MKNTLVDLQNHLFEMIETLNDNSLKGDKLDQEIKRSMALNELAKTAVTNGALMVKAVDVLYGIPVSDDIPLLPKAKGETFLVNNKKQLTSVPKDDEYSGYKKKGNRERPI